MEYEIYWDPAWSVPAILEDREDIDRFGNRFVLVARTPEGVEICLAVPSNCKGPGSKYIEPVQRLSPVARRVEPLTEATLLGAWGLK